MNAMKMSIKHIIQKIPNERLRIIFSSSLTSGPYLYRLQDVVLCFTLDSVPWCAPYILRTLLKDSDMYGNFDIKSTQKSATNDRRTVDCHKQNLGHRVDSRK
jgi:hypothetical protein